MKKVYLSLLPLFGLLFTNCSDSSPNQSNTNLKRTSQATIEEEDEVLPEPGMPPEWGLVALELVDDLAEVDNLTFECTNRGDEFPGDNKYRFDLAADEEQFIMLKMIELNSPNTETVIFDRIKVGVKKVDGNHSFFLKVQDVTLRLDWKGKSTSLSVSRVDIANGSLLSSGSYTDCVKQ